MSSNTHSLPVSAVVTTYNGLHLLQKNLPAVLKTLRPGDELVIVDDCSSDESVSWLKEKFLPLAEKTKVKLTVVVNEKNLRYALSCNKGVKKATHPLVFLLNNDVSPQANCLQFLLPFFNETQVFAVSCLEKAYDQSGKVSESGKNRLWFERGLFQHSRAEDLQTGETAWATGGSSLFDKEKFLQLGGFDQRFAPAYWEDIDLSFRAKKQGWQVIFCQDAKVDHNHESTNQDVFGQKKIKQMSWRNADKFTLKNGSWWQKILFFCWWPYWQLQRSKNIN